MRFWGYLKEATERQEESAASAFAPRTTNSRGAKQRFEDKGARYVVQEIAVRPTDEYLAAFVPSTGVDLAPEEWRQVPKLMKITTAGQNVLVSAKLVTPERAQSQWSTKRELLDWSWFAVESRARSAVPKNQAARANGLEQ